MVEKHSPTKATIYALVLPGLGQVYNKKYWKLPVVYAGFGGIGYWVWANNKNFTTYRKAYAARVDNDPNTTDEFTDKYTADNLYTLKDYYNRIRDLSVICLAGFYMLTVVDATVDAHFFTYDVAPGLTLNVSPYSHYNYNGFLAQGLTLKLNF